MFAPLRNCRSAILNKPDSRRFKKRKLCVDRLEFRLMPVILVDLGVFAGPAANVTGVDSKAEVIGQKLPSSSSTAYQAFFLDNNGVATAISPLPGYTDSFANALADTGQVVGYSQESSSGGG